MKLKKYKLRKLCLPNQIGKYGIPAPAIAYSNGKIRYLRISDISEEGTLVNTDKKSVESDDIEQYILEENDIVFARTGNSTGRAYLYDKRDGVMAYAGFLIKYQLDEHKVNPIYLRYFTLSTFYKQWVANLSVGSTRGNISAQTFADCPIVLPPRHQQDVLVETLSNIDAKIKLNRQINDNLEAMAKQLYDYWFVQFDFPNEEGKPYKSSGGAMVWNEKLKHQIPEGWEVKQLRDIIETNRGISYNTSSISGGGVPMINLASFNVDGSYKDAGLKSYNGNYTQEKILKPFDLVLCNTQQTAIEFSKDIIGKAFLIPDIFDGDIVSSHHINTIKTEEVLKPYLAYLSNTYHFHKYATGCCSGTNILGLDYNSFSQYKLEIPPKYLLKEFHDFIIDIVKRKSLIIKENKLLTKQRNELLPLLMNGQATVNYHLSVLFIAKIMLGSSQILVHLCI